MTLLDANALLALLRGQPAAGQVADLLRREDCATPAPCLTEIVDRMIRRWGASPDQTAERLGALVDEAVNVLGVDSATAWRAGDLRAAHYHRKTAALSLADCILLASATPGDQIATSDRAVAATARGLGIDLIPLLNGNGERPDVD